MSVKIDEISDLMAEYMSNYTQDVADEMKKAIDKVSQEANEEIKAHITFKRHKGDKYVKSFRIKTSYEDKFNKRNTWYVAAPYYRLTHLLENGHATIDGGRTKEYPHIKYGEELAQRRMEELAKEAIENANGR
ncbi:MAG: hypothetical protein Q8933_09235 [Bacteroidota bacterium]|nr:hypothetical protein [Bacteroidota bacterium]